MITSITSETPEAITSGQIKQVVRFVSDAAGKATESAIEKLAKTGHISHSSLQRVIGKGDELTEIVNEFIQKKILELGAAVKQIRVWIRAKVGGVSKSELVSGLDNVQAGDTGLTFCISDYAKDLTSKPACIVSEIEEEAEFAIAAPQDLGFKSNPTTTEFFDEVNLAKYGLELCRPDDPHSIRKVYTNQPDGEWLPIGMKPILGSDGYWHVFRLSRDGSRLCLGASYGADPQVRWGLGCRMLFRVRKIRTKVLDISVKALGI